MAMDNLLALFDGQTRYRGFFCFLYSKKISVDIVIHLNSIDLE
ncbi:hypothetical protein LG58_580 [Kosakonia radicincitans YD4]|nr:hypothetical protein LG58_580 [Kosakonia radicincitans YD4]